MVIILEKSPKTMLYCPNPNCPQPFNPDGNKFCQTCGKPLLTLFRNRYRVVRLLGAGGFSRTYYAEDTDCMDAPCVVKQFLPQVEGEQALQKATELFKQEAKRLYELGEHPQIPRLIAYFEQDQRLYLVQELIQGQTLLDEFIQQGAFNQEKIYQILIEILPILHYIHERHVIHRDIKPTNIMRSSIGDCKLVLIDFGVSKHAAGTMLSKAATTVGTPGYAPIEQMRGIVYPSSDLYSLGVTCIRLLTGCFPEPDGSDLLYDPLSNSWQWRKHISADGISPELGEILDRLTQESIGERYQTAAEVLAILQPTTSGVPPSIPPAPPPRPLTPPPSLSSPTQPPITSLVSPRGIDYHPLKELLTQKKWQEADQETTDQLLAIVGKTKLGYLVDADFSDIPLADLRIIDDLWMQSSQGQFGFSVQQQIWMEEGGQPGVPNQQVWCRVADRLGWRVAGEWVYYDDIQFNQEAPQGHLPIIGLGQWKNGLGKWLFTGNGLWYVGCLPGLTKRLMAKA